MVVGKWETYSDVQLLELLFGDDFEIEVANRLRKAREERTSAILIAAKWLAKANNISMEEAFDNVIVELSEREKWELGYKQLEKV